MAIGPAPLPRLLDFLAPPDIPLRSDVREVSELIQPVVASSLPARQRAEVVVFEWQTARGLAVGSGGGVVVVLEDLDVVAI